MKKQAIIPLFIPHMGCPHDCVFCNQKLITASDGNMDKDAVREIMETRLADLEPLGLTQIEAAFFGGSFTGLPIATQQELLEAVLPYKIAGHIQKIRLSTRPDYIDSEILSLLSSFTVDIIELGAQSFDDNVLFLSARGHTAKQTIEACQMIRQHGFSLGIQLMIGLPGDSKEKALQSAVKAIEMNPDFVRIYPTVVLQGSKLAEMYLGGTYSPPSTEDAVEIAKDMVRLFDREGIPVIRIGLKSTDNICRSTDLAGSYHPAFRQLVDGALAYDDMILQLQKSGISLGTAVLTASPGSFSNLIGHKGVNKKRFAMQYPQVGFIYKTDSSLPDKKYVLNIQ